MKIDDSKLIKLLTIGIGLVSVIAIVLIIVVWKVTLIDDINKKVPSTIEQELGKFTYTDYKSTQVLNRYIGIFNEYLNDADMDKLYELLSDDYKQKYSCTKESLYNDLRLKGLLGKKFTDIQYQGANVLGNIVYSITLKSDDQTISADINFIEESPNNFKFTLDNYLFTKKVDKEQIINGVKLNIKEVEVLKNRVITTAKLSNDNASSIFLNSQNKNECMYYRMESYDGNVDYVTDSSTFLGKVKELPAYSDIDIKFESQIAFTNISQITTLVIKDTKLSQDGANIELEYNF